MFSKSYQILIEEKIYPPNTVILGGFHTYPRYSGPREALFTMICRQNMGCSHFIVGRDHSGVGKFYSKNAAAQFIKSFQDDIDIKAIYFDGDLLDGSELKRIAEMPTKEELLAMLAALLNSSMTKLARTLQAPMANVGYALRNLKEHKTN